MSAMDFINTCIDLFVSVLSAILGQPVLAFFAAVAVMLAVLGLFAWMVIKCRR